MIYLDNGATSFPKPANTLNAAADAMRNYGFNSGRGGYTASVKTAEKIYSVREKLGDFFNYPTQNIAFTANCTAALNMAIKGSVKKGGHIIISSLEHNAVWRVVNHLKKDGIADFDIAGFSYDDDETVGNFERLIKSRTSAIVCTAASNVFGVALPIGKIGEMAKRHGIRFIVDGAQAAGVMPLDAERDNIDILCAPGHKCLYGLMGTGFIAVRDGVHLETILDGGTGSDSLNPDQPDFLPDRLEAGTLNNIGIISLGAGVDFINSFGMDNIYSRELEHAQRLYDGLSANKNAVLYTKRPEKYKNAPIVSFNFGDYPSEKTAAVLGRRGIAVRAGLHCAPLAHSYFGTVERGTVRLCPSVFTTRQECEFLINTVKKL